MWLEIFKNNKITVTYNSEPQPAKTIAKKSVETSPMERPANKMGLPTDHDTSRLEPHTRGVFQSRDHTSIYYEIYGQGKPLLLCYGLVCRREHWRYQLACFAKKYQVILFDYRGHQFSSQPTNDQHLTLDWCAYDIEDLLIYLKVEEVVGIGHSMGVGVLTRAVALDKSKFKAIIFICGTVKNPFERMFHSNRMNRVHQVSSVLFDVMPGVVSSLWQKLTQNNVFNFILASRLGFNADRSKDSDVNSYLEGVHQIPFSVFHALIDDYTRFDGQSYLKQIECPALIIAGEKDMITPKEVQDEIVSSLKNSEMHLIPEGSHNSHTDFPNEVNIAIDNFLEKIGYQ